MKPPSRSWHWGQTVAAEHDVNGLDQIDAEMRCAVARVIAESKLLAPREKLTDDLLIRHFKRGAEKIDTDPDLPVEDCLTEDYLAFAKWGLERDAEIRKTQPDAVVGPASWLPIFRETEQLIRGELWPAVQAVGEKLSWSTVDLRDEDVGALASRALNCTVP